MRAIFSYFAKTVIKRIVLTMTTLLLVGANSANSVIIDFDDIKQIPADDIFPHFSDHPLTDQYLDKGLLIVDGFLVGKSLPDGSNDNKLLGATYLDLYFVGALPTFVSMNVSASSNQAVFLTAFGVDGWLAHKQTSGFAGPHNDTPYVDNQFVSFYSATGIASINLSAFFGLRTGAVVDNLFYEYNTSVSESSPLVLLLCGLLMIAASSLKHANFALIRK